VRGTDGREWTAEVLANRGGALRPLSDEELATKFADNVAGRLEPAAATTVRDLALNLDSVTDVGDLMASLSRFIPPAATGAERGEL